MASKQAPDIAFLEAYAQAWNDHDIDAIMNAMSEDCIFETGGGSNAWGTRFEGAEVVRERFKAVWEDLPDVEFANSRHFVSGDRGCSEWIFKATRPDGTRMEMAGCDLFTFKDGKIWIKSTLLKNVS
jgi:ketosteroid isomerase-like protein